MNRILLLIGLIVLAYATCVSAQDVWDPYFRNGAVRTEYAPGFGSAPPGQAGLTLDYSQPGQEGCLFDADIPANISRCPGRAGLETSAWFPGLQRRLACGGDTTLNPTGDSWLGCLNYTASPYFALNNPGSHYWVVHANAEPSFDQCRPGPPGISFPVVDPMQGQQGLFKVAMEPFMDPVSGDGRNRLHLIINADEHAYACANDAAMPPTSIDTGHEPFLSVGAESGYGNPGPVATISRQSLRGLKPLISFKASIYGQLPFGCRADTYCASPPPWGGNWAYGVHAGIYLRSYWSGKPRLLFVGLWGEGDLEFSASTPANSNWSWPIRESMFYPGADAASFVAGDPGCAAAIPRLAPPSNGQLGAWVSYHLNLNVLFKCASDLNMFSDPMPATGRLEVTGVHWFIESLGTTGAFWMAVQDVSGGRRSH